VARKPILDFLPVFWDFGLVHFALQDEECPEERPAVTVDFAKLQEVFLAAVERHRPEDWDTYLNQACADDDELRRQVNLLLKAHLEAGSVPGAAASDPAQTGVYMAAAVAPGQSIGPYKLLEPIGEGGMGAVWMAQQTEPVKRLVALKLIKAGMDSKQVIARFEAERQALALMDHANIAKVLDAGTTGTGWPYFVMDLVKGVPITKYCDDHHLTPRQRLELFVPVCQAIQHAHQKGVIHRDIKPSNVLVASYDWRPVPKVIDFGVAKAIGQQLTEQTVYTGFGAVVGTVEYMSPEQAGLNQLDIDTRSDIYSLGVLLYELLTGTTPLQHERVKATGLLEALRIVREEEVPTLSNRLGTTEQLAAVAANCGLEPAKLTRLVRGELDWIVMKALAKDRSRRYDSASAFAADVQRFLTDEPVQACPPSALYRLRKFVRRHRGAVLAAGAAVATLFLMAVLALASTYRINQAYEALEGEQAKTADALRRETALTNQLSDAQEQDRRALYFHGVALAYREWQAQRMARADYLLGQCPEEFRDWEWHYLYRLCHSDLLTLSGHAGQVDAVAFAPDGTRLASGGGDGAVKVWELATGREVLHLQGHADAVLSVAFSPDGTRLAAAHHYGKVRVWDLATGREISVMTAQGPGPSPRTVVFSPDGQRLAAGGVGGANVWEVETGRGLFHLPGHNPVAFSPDGKHLAAAIGGQVKVVDALTGQEQFTFPRTSFRTISGLVFGPDGHVIAAAVPNNRTVVLWDSTTTKVMATLISSEVGYGALAFRPDGKRLATAGPLGSVLVWDLQTAKTVDTIQGHKERVLGLAFSPDGQLLASASADGTVKLWSSVRSREALTVPARHGNFIGLAFSPDSGCLAAMNYDGRCLLAEPALGREVEEFPAHDKFGGRVAFSPDGTRLATTGKEREGGQDTSTVKIWDRATMQLKLAWAPRQGFLTDLAFSPDGTRLATAGVASRDGKVWDTATGQELLTLTGHERPLCAVAFSPDGTRLASAGGDGTARVWDAACGRELLTLQGHAGGARCVAFSGDGLRLASGGNDRTVKLWDAVTGRELRTLGGHPGGVAAVAFNPAGRRVAVGTTDGSVILWDPDTGAEALTLRPGDPQLRELGLAFSPDGRRLASCHANVIALLDGTPLKPAGPPRAPGPEK
jgi:WD40 repeat protein/serine/threonine protein kinase